MSTELDTCDCGPAATSTEITNAAGQSALSYRIGTWSTFLDSMKAALPTTAIASGDNAGDKPLADLTVRSPDDPTIALLDAFACVLDVMTFYQERIANEGYLRTATEDRSLHELARMIGYQPSPGVSASTYLAFTVMDATGAPEEATVPEGTQVMSVPGQDQLPQLFETSADLECHKDWNLLVPKQKEAFTFAKAKEIAEAAGLTVGASATPLVFGGTGHRLSVGDLILLVNEDVYQSNSQETTPPAMVRNTDFFGAPIESVTEDMQESRTIVVLRSVLEVGSAEPEKVPISAATQIAASDGTIVSGVFCYVFRVTTRAFGYNAPDLLATPDSSDASKLLYTENSVSGFAGSYIVLAEEQPSIIPDTWFVVALFNPLFHMPPWTIVLFRAGMVTVYQASKYGMSSKCTIVSVDDSMSEIPTDDALLGAGMGRSLLLLAAPEALTLADLPVSDPIAAGSSVLTLDSVITEIEEGRLLLMVDEDGTSEVVTVSACDNDTDADHTILTIEGTFTNEYDAATVKIYANVVLATHGESVSETLGSGDGAKTNQPFTLANTPLTHVSAATPSGSESTLSITVGGIGWTRVDSFFEQAADAEVYTEHRDEDGYTVVTFGDGVVGARLPTGTNNVASTYRKGLGSAGNVDATTITLLRTRPFGIAAATNPIAASGGEDAEDGETLRTNAPLDVLTLDRLVSIGDYQAFASAFAGVGAARVDIVRVEGRDTVVVSVLDASGAEASTTLIDNLTEAIASYGDPDARVAVVTATVKTFTAQIGNLIAADADPDTVKAAIEAKLLERFAWSERTLGQGVRVSEVIAAVMEVEGVLATIVWKLLRGSVYAPDVNSVVLAAGHAYYTGTELKGAVMLCISTETGGITLGTESV